MNDFINKLIISSGASLVVTENLQLQPLYTALITFAVTLITILTYEGGAWLKAYLKAKKAKAEKEEQELKEHKQKCEEADEICQIADAEKDKEE